MDARRREALAAKARRLCEDCAGGSACAKGFVRHHLALGEPEVARDVEAWLGRECESLTASDPDGRLEATRALLARVREMLAEG